MNEHDKNTIHILRGALVNELVRQRGNFPSAGEVMLTADEIAAISVVYASTMDAASVWRLYQEALLIARETIESINALVCQLDDLQLAENRHAGKTSEKEGSLPSYEELVAMLRGKRDQLRNVFNSLSEQKETSTLLASIRVTEKGIEIALKALLPALDDAGVIRNANRSW